MTLQSHKESSRRALEMWAGGAPIDTSLFAPGYVNHQQPVAAGGVGEVSLAQWIEIVKANHRAFPDLNVRIEAQIAEGDQVATYWRFSATQTGPYQNRTPSGRKVSWTGVQIDRYQDGKFAESWVIWDKFSQFQTLDMLS